MPSALAKMHHPHGRRTNILTSFTPPQKGAGMMLAGDGKDTTDKLAGILAAKHII